MKYATAAATLAFAACAYAQNQAVEQGGPLGQEPEDANPEGCLDSLDYVFSFQTTEIGPREGQAAGDAKSKRENVLEARQQANTFECAGITLALSLNEGTLLDNFTDPKVGSVVANDQFQFDGAPTLESCIQPQTGVKYSAGFCVLGNGTLTLGSSSVFYNCRSGSFDNIYFSRIADEGCQPVRLDTRPCAPIDGQPAKVKKIEDFTRPGCPLPDGSDADGQSNQSESSSSSSSTSETASATTSSAPENLMSEMPSAPPGMMSAPYTVPAAAAPAGTAPAGTASQAVPPSPTGSSTAAPSPFTGAASALEAGQKILAAAAFGAVALLF